MLAVRSVNSKLWYLCTLDEFDSSIVAKRVLPVKLGETRL